MLPAKQSVLVQSGTVIEAQPAQPLIPYNENLLERPSIQWQFGDWPGLGSYTTTVREG